MTGWNVTLLKLGTMYCGFILSNDVTLNTLMEKHANMSGIANNRYWILFSVENLFVKIVRWKIDNPSGTGNDWWIQGNRPPVNHYLFGWILQYGFILINWIHETWLALKRSLNMVCFVPNRVEAWTSTSSVLSLS